MLCAGAESVRVGAADLGTNLGPALTSTSVLCSLLYNLSDTLFRKHLEHKSYGQTLVIIISFM